MEKYEGIISETIPLNVPTKVVVPKGVLIKVKNLDMKQNQFEFKPFDQVLVRDSDTAVWYPAFFKYYNEDDEDYPYTCDNLSWKQCIPYNEETAHLCNTSEPYKKSEPKVWKVTCHKNNEVFHFTNDELKHFIENAVTNNKDIQWFTTTYEGNNN